MVVPPLPKVFNILSLPGGGVRGIIEIVLIQRLLEKFPTLLRDTDLIVGTSTGGIIALGLAAELPLSEIRDLYENQTELIFKDTLVDNIKDLGKLRGADYDNTNLKKILEDRFGDMKLSELKKKVTIVSFDLDNEEPDREDRSWKPKIFHNFDNGDGDGDLKVVDVALYTSAAPTIFPSVGGFIDGGVVANNPSMVATIQAMDKRGPAQKLEDLRLLCVGNGKIKRYVKGERLDWGLWQWALPLLYILFEGSGDMVNFECKTLLTDKYHSIEPQLKRKFSLDGWKNVPQLIEIAEKEDITATVGWLKSWWNQAPRISKET